MPSITAHGARMAGSRDVRQSAGGRVVDDQPSQTQRAAACIRHRSNGYVPSGSSDAWCPQYSNSSRRRPPQAIRSSSARG